MNRNPEWHQTENDLYEIDLGQVRMRNPTPYLSVIILSKVLMQTWPLCLSPTSGPHFQRAKPSENILPHVISLPFFCWKFSLVLTIFVAPLLLAVEVSHKVSAVFQQLRADWVGSPLFWDTSYLFSVKLLSSSKGSLSW